MLIKRFFSLLLCLAAACSSGGRKAAPPQEKKPLILVSIAPYQTMVRTIAGDSFEVAAIVPPNANPHSYEPTSKQVSQMQRGDIWFQIGEPFETKLTPLLKKTELVDLRQGVSMIDTAEHHCHACGQDHLDRHIWLSPKQTALQADHIAQSLSARYPDHAPQFEAHCKELKKNLGLLDAEISRILERASGRTFLVSHPAFAYFCRDYGLEQLSVEQEGKDPRPKDLEAVYLAAEQHRTGVAFALPQHNNKGAQLIAGKLRIPVRVIDPYSPEYFETMRALAGWIANPYKTNDK